MKILKRITAVLLAFLLVFSFAACNDNGNQADESTTSYEREAKTRIAEFSGISSLGISKLKADRGYAYSVSSHTDLQEIETLLKNGETDLAAVPVEFAAKLFNDTKGGVKIIAINSLGSIYLVSKDESIKGLADIGSKTVYASGKGTASEYVINYIFGKNNINPNVEYVATDAELAALAIEGKADICILSEPMATKVVMGNAEMKRAVDFAEEWKKASGSGQAQSVIVARTEYIEKNSEYIEQFLMHNEISINFFGEYIEVGAKMLTELKYFSTIDNARECLPYCKLYFIRGEEMKPLVQSVCDALPAEMTGGTVNADGICFVQ